MPAPTRTDADDDLDELPPLDGDQRDAPEPEAVPDELDDPGDASLDDSTGEDDPAGSDDLDLDGSAEDGGWLNEPADAQDLDLGDTALVDLDDGPAGPDDGEGPVTGDEDFGFGNAPERGGLDGGDEGPFGADDELHEADLPQLDADEEGDVDEAALIEPGFGADEPAGLPWAAEPWSRVGAPLALVAVTAVACAPRGALVAGRSEGGAAELLRVDLEGASEAVPAAGLDPAQVRALAVEGEAVVALAANGQLWRSGDGGAAFVRVADGVAVVEMALLAGTLWARTRAGMLVRIDEAGVPTEVEPGRDVPGRALASLSEDASVQVVRGEHAAYAGQRGEVLRRDLHGAWKTYSWEGRITALAFVDDAGTLVAATYSEQDDTTALVRLEAGATGASVVARVGSAGGFAVGADPGADGGTDGAADGAVRAIAHDAARGVVWVAGGFGVAAFAVR